MGPSSANTEPIDDRIIQKIKSLVAAGKTDPDDVLESLEDFARLELKAGDRDRRKFFPKRLDVINAINRAKLKIRFDPKEQEAIRSSLPMWGTAEDEVFFRPMKTTKDSGKEHPDRNCTFLFVYQNWEMKRLYRLYGGNTLFLDAIHRTSEYAWPFYTLVVNTNSSYQIVGFFVTQHESKVTISEGLRVIKTWNPKVRPEFGLVNRPWEDLKAMEAIFPETKTFVSAFHRNRAWRKKMERRENDGVDREEVLFLLQQVAEAKSEKELRRAIAHLKDNDNYNSSTMKAYYESSWHLQMKRWVGAYKPQDMLFDMNGGLLRIADDIRYDYLSQFKSKPLSDIINAFITNYIPSNLVTYRRENSQILRKHKIHHSGIPFYLKRCSEWVLDQVLIAHFEATEESEQHYAQYVSENSFIISSVNSNKLYEVRFEPVNKRISCTCSALPGKVVCKHILIVGLKFPEWHLSKISCWLFDNPIYQVDFECVHHLDNDGVDAIEEVITETDAESSVFHFDEGIDSIGKSQRNILAKNSLVSYFGCVLLMLKFSCRIFYYYN